VAIPTSPRALDDHGPIEAVIKETARGRAFLTEYARRVRQSDTLTLLALVGRLERVCQELAGHLANPNGPALPEGPGSQEQSMASTDALSNGDRNREALDRIAHLVEVLRNPDRKVVDPGHHPPAGPVSDALLDDLIVTETEGAIPTDPLSENESGPRVWPNASGRRPLPEETLLGDIAKALEE
jgi:hypothetical protein